MTLTLDPNEPVTQREMQAWREQCDEHRAKTDALVLRDRAVEKLIRRARGNRRRIVALQRRIAKAAQVLFSNRILAITTAGMVFLILVAHIPQLQVVIPAVVRAIIHG